MDWRHQQDEPLFPDVIWSRPLNNNGAGKLLIIGGSSGAMSNLATNFGQAQQSGIGTIHLLVPDSLQKVTKHIPEINYAPATPSGSFARKSLIEFLGIARNVDAVFLAGDMGKNSETSILLEAFFHEYSGLLSVSSRALESFSIKSSNILNRENTILFMNFNQLQNLGKELGLTVAFTSDMGIQQFAKLLHDLTMNSKAILIVDNETIWISEKNKLVDLSSTNFSEARATVHGLQQSEKLFKALVSSVF